jgi:hypothetical protein
MYYPREQATSLQRFAKEQMFADVSVGSIPVCLGQLSHVAGSGDARFLPA